MRTCLELNKTNGELGIFLTAYMAFPYKREVPLLLQIKVQMCVFLCATENLMALRTK